LFLEVCGLFAAKRREFEDGKLVYGNFRAFCPDFIATRQFPWVRPPFVGSVVAIMAYHSASL